MSTRTALLDSAEKAARQRGFDAFSYADLARDVGIRKASIHHHFPAKADLALGLIERYAARFVETLKQINAEQCTAAEKLRAYHSVYHDALAGGSRLCLCVSLSAGRDSLSDPVLEQLNQFHLDSIAWLTEVFQLAMSDKSVVGVSRAATEASSTLALMEGAQLMSRAANDPAPFQQATQVLLDRLS